MAGGMAPGTSLRVKKVIVIKNLDLWKEYHEHTKNCEGEGRLLWHGTTSQNKID